MKYTLEIVRYTISFWCDIYTLFIHTGRKLALTLYFSLSPFYRNVEKETFYSIYAMR